MQYRSTRTYPKLVSDAEAIVAGLAPDGGLFLPTEIPALTEAELSALMSEPYEVRAARVMSKFLTSFSYEELLGYTRLAYAKAKFPVTPAAPVVTPDGRTHILELFHGPTCAFKDFALQLLPYLLRASLQKTGVKEEVLILVATSGDTGKAALAGFADVPGTHICVFYPQGGVSMMQKLQMTTQTGANVMVSAVAGNFDDVQNGVKTIFSDKSYAETLLSKNIRLSSANSINWGRLVPQIAYYVSAYCELCKSGALKLGEPLNVCVPTGNFGNILACWYAKRMGLPVKTLICASNSNNVLTDFIKTGVYDRNRPFYLTDSPSMDILISSNLERLVSLLGTDGAQMQSYMDALKQSGRYALDPAAFDNLRAEFDCGFCDDAQGGESIRALYEQTGYLCDTHTAVALNVCDEYRARTGDGTHVLVVSTASPFKFPEAVLNALGRPCEGSGGFAMLRELSGIAGIPVPPQLASLEGQNERFTGACAKSEMPSVIDAYLEGRA